MIDKQYCLKISCGCISQAEAGPENLYACSSTYGGAVYPSGAPQCAGLCPEPQIPQALIQSATQPPFVTGTPTAQPAATLSIYNVTSPMPDITAALQPVETGPKCSLWCDLNEAIENHPVIAGGALIALFAAMIGHKRRRR